MGLFSKKKKETKQAPAPAPARHVETVSFKVAGISNYGEAIKALSEGQENDWFTATKKELKENYMLDEKIYQYDFAIRKTELLPEPDNPHDKNAIKVMMDQELVGYVPKTKCKAIKEILDTKEIKLMTGEIYGGKYKCVSDDDIEKGETEYGAMVQIVYYIE